MSCPGNPYDGHTLADQVAQTNQLIVDTERAVKQTVVDLGYRGVDADNPQVQIIHRGKPSQLTRQQRRWLRRCQAIEPGIGHLKSDHRMNRCYLPGALGDALNALCSAVGYNLRWLIWAVGRLKLAAVFLRLVRSAASLTQWRNLFRPQQMQGFARDYAHTLSCIGALPTLRIVS